jgi:hypothetical protein
VHRMQQLDMHACSTHVDVNFSPHDDTLAYWYGRQPQHTHPLSSSLIVCCPAPCLSSFLFHPCGSCIMDTVAVVDYFECGILLLHYSPNICLAFSHPVLSFLSAAASLTRWR